MFRLFSLIYTLAGPTLAGIGVIATLTMGMVDLKAILIAAGAGAVLASPAAWIIAAKLREI